MNIECGKEFGRLTVLSRHGTAIFGKDKKQVSTWLCKCACGTELVVSRNSLRKGTGSCGCLQRERAKEHHLKHGKAGTRMYGLWQQMVQRCNSPLNEAYGKYGAAGVSVCDRWLGESGYENFMADVGNSRPSTAYSLDRFPNPFGNYEPGNVRWATKKDQARNLRATCWILLNDARIHPVDVAKAVGMKDVSGLLKRIKKLGLPKGPTSAELVLTKQEQEIVKCKFQPA